jgi:CspA family cold shock protein
MTSTTKALVISPVLGVIAFLVIGYIHHQTLYIPSTPADLAELVVIIGAVLAAGLLSREGAPAIEESGEEETGTVKWFNVKKGYGFITRDRGDDVFVHYRNIQDQGQGRRTIAEGQRVRFIVVSGDKGLQADEVESI